MQINIITDYPDIENLPTLQSSLPLPENATFDPNMGVFLWTPGDNQVGETGLTFTATASDGETASLTLTVDVQAKEPADEGNNVPPRFLRIGSVEIAGDELPRFEVKEGQTLELPIDAQDADGDALTYAATGLPDGAELSDGGILWTPPLDTVSAAVGEMEFVVDLWVSDDALKAAIPISIFVGHTDPTTSVSGYP